MKSFFQKPYFLILLLIVLVELLSFLGYLVPWLDQSLFFILSILILVLAFKKLDWAILVLLVELFVGSKGHLFSFEVGFGIVSLRMVIYLAVLLAWLGGLGKKKYDASFVRSKFFIPYCLLFIFVLLGLISGLLKHNLFSFIFLDFNAWLYFLLVFPIFDIFKNQKNIDNLIKVFFAALSWLAIKTFLVFFLFSHQVKAIMPDLYYWIRLKGLGEITALEPVYRVFFQSQIYSLIGFFIFLSFIIFSANQNKKSFLFLMVPILPIILSFSRSFWLAFLLTFFAYFIFLKIKEKFSWLKLGRIFLSIIAIFVVSFGFLWFSLQLPPKAVFDLGDLFNKRLGANEPAALSRLAQAPFLISAVLKSPTVGSGFGATVSYFSKDPRALERESQGLYTTYAFEWGYLDIWLKIGFAGLFVFLSLIWLIFKEGFKKITNDQKALIIGLLFGLIALAITHIFSPYLNHPLGIGYLLICTTIFFYGEKRT